MVIPRQEQNIWKSIIHEWEAMLFALGVLIMGQTWKLRKPGVQIANYWIRYNVPSVSKVAKPGSRRHVKEGAPEQEKNLTSGKQQSQIFKLMKLRWLPRI